MRSNDSILLVTFSVTVAAIVVVAIAPAHIAFGSLAEWAAAVGTISAVFAALYTAGHATRVEQQRNDSRARVCAQFLVPYIISIYNRIDPITQYAQANNWGLDRMADMGFSIAVRRGIGIWTEIPSKIFENAWTLPKQLARDCIRLDFFLRQYQQIVADQIDRFRQMDGGERGLYVDTISLSFRNVSGLATRCRDGLTKLLDESPGT